MPTFAVRLVCEPGPDPVDGCPLGGDEEALTVEADSLWAARSLALHRMTLRPMGRVLRAFDADTGRRDHSAPARGLPARPVRNRRPPGDL